MAKLMLINTIDEEESRMAIVENGQLTEFHIKMAIREPITGNIYKGVVRSIQKGLQAAFVDYGAQKNGFLPLRDVSTEYLDNGKTLQQGRELFVQVVREESGSKGAMLTTYISLPGRYTVLMPNRDSRGVSRRIESDADRKKLKQLMDEISEKEGMGFIVRTAGINRTKQELLRDFQMMTRLWKGIQKKAEGMAAPVLVYKESEFAIRVLRDYFTSDIDEILVDDVETLKVMKNYCRAVSPRSVKSVKPYKGETPIFDKYNIEEQINAIYRERVELKSGGSLIIEPTEAVITIDVNSGRSHKRDVEETSFRTNLEAAEEIAKQLRLRDLGGLIVIDFIDMMDRKHISEVERTFKEALKNDRSRIQLARISKFGILELSRQKKQSNIQEISYTTCNQCKGSGWIPSIEYLALNTFRKVKTEAVRRDASEIEITLPADVASYLLNNKRSEINKLEQTYDVSVYIRGSTDMIWTEAEFNIVRKAPPVPQEQAGETGTVPVEETAGEGTSAGPEKSGKQGEERLVRRRRPRRRRPKAISPAAEGTTESPDGGTGNEIPVIPEENLVPDAVVEDREDDRKEGIVRRFYNLLKT
ncbi:MAG: ribonuclease E/G [Syntrophales bacterium]|jgi:ribonuclease E|nr:ribonuclease E/G [Syntrophales bacterium]MCK9528278.1 ribonuclease E/G [Syntrophales bacterium]MDX9922410.1 ribonuclease E/G [Syntrophales bacterium]